MPINNKKRKKYKDFWNTKKRLSIILIKYYNKDKRQKAININRNLLYLLQNGQTLNEKNTKKKNTKCSHLKHPIDNTNNLPI